MTAEVPHKLVFEAGRLGFRLCISALGLVEPIGNSERHTVVASIFPPPGALKQQKV